MRFATYGRKSVYSDKSDSVDNQFRMCREFAELKFPGQIECFEPFQDEGFTGANTNRPGLERLLEAVKAGFIDALVVYQLDRISRDVRDFSNIYGLLEEKRVMFISIKENIDTATPIGRAMMYVTMVFAQMERETIASRVSDNMVGLAKKGLWPVGTVPIGYRRKQVILGGKKHSTLEIEPDGAGFVREIYADFLASERSVNSMMFRYKREGKRGLTGEVLSEATLYRVLTTPVYCAATQELYDYYNGLGCKIDPASPRELWDGSRAVLVYGKRKRKKELKPPGEWVVCLGIHEPIISSSDWLAVQTRFEQNTYNKTMKYDVPLLKGIVHCAKCGWVMRVARKKYNNGTIHNSYVCLKRARQGADVCNMKSIACDRLDEKVIEIFRGIEADPGIVNQYAVPVDNDNSRPNTAALERRIASQKMKLDRLAASLSDAETSTARKYIVAEIERQDMDLQALQRELEIEKAALRRDEQKKKDLADRAREIGDLMRGFDALSDSERNSVVREVVQECKWDGTSLFLRL